jgi:hypothetical protein
MKLIVPTSLYLFLSVVVWGIPDAWNTNTTYNKDDVVLYTPSGTSEAKNYIALQTGAGNQPDTSTAFWSLLDSVASSFSAPPGDPTTFSTPDTNTIPTNSPPDSNSTSSVASGHPNASNEAFVKQQYLDFLEREAEGTGLSDWVNILENGWDSDGDGTNDPFTRADLVNIKVSSAEYDNKIAPIVRLYFAYLGRRPESQGFADWVKYKIGQGPGEWAGREMTIEEMSQFFADAQEFIDKYGSLSDSEFVALLYTNVQGREGSADEIAAWVDILENGYDGESWNRGRVMVGFSESSEYKTKMDPEVRVYALYWGLLNRVPDDVGWDGADGPGGEKGWPDYIKEGWSPNVIINGFLDSEEYLNRFNSTAPYAEK